MVEELMIVEVADSASSEDEMAKIDDLLARVGVIEAWVKIGGSVSTFILLGWLGWLSHNVYSLAGDVRAMKQADKDRGVEIVSQIAKPSSAEEQQLALITAGANLRKASQLRIKPDQAKLSSLSSALLSSASRTDPPAEVWKVAADLISYRSEASFDFRTGSKPPCFSLALVRGPRLGQPGHFRFDGADCSLDLNDVEAYQRSSVFTSAKENTPAGRVFVYLNIVGANVSFDPSRPVISIVALNCHFCSFSVNPSETVSAEGKAVIRTLLAEDKPFITLPLSTLGFQAKQVSLGELNPPDYSQPRPTFPIATYIFH